MKSLPVAVALLLLASACAPTAPSAQPTPTVTAAPVLVAPVAGGTVGVLAEARQFVFRARNAACLATGTAFAFDGTVVTNRHVAAGASSLQLATWSGTDFNASVAGHSPGYDLARLTATLPTGTVAPSAGTPSPATGTPVYVAGYPEGNQLTVTTGPVTGITTAPELDVSGPVLQISDAVRPGNSGSPVLDGSGRVVGVVFALDTASGHGLAMPLSSLRSFLASQRYGPPLPCAP